MIVLPRAPAAEDLLQPRPLRWPRPALALASSGSSRPSARGAGPGTWLAAPTPPRFAADVMGASSSPASSPPATAGCDLRALFSGAGVAEGARHGGHPRPRLRHRPRRHARERLAAPRLRRPAAARLPHLRGARRAAPQPGAAVPLQPGGEHLRRARRGHEQRPRRGQGAAAVRPRDRGVHRPRRRARRPRAAGRSRPARPGRRSRPRPRTPGCSRQVVEEGKPLLMPRHTRDARGAPLAGAYGMRDAVVVPLTGRPASSARSSSPTGSATSAPSTRTTSSCWRPSPTTPASRCATASSSASCATTPCTTRSPACRTGRTCSAAWPPRWTTLSEAAVARRRGHDPRPRRLQAGQRDPRAPAGRPSCSMEVAPAARGRRRQRPAPSPGSAATSSPSCCPDAGDEDRVLHLGRRILRALEQPVALDGLEVEVGASLGVALAPAHADDPAALLKRADMAMYDAKTSTRGSAALRARSSTPTTRDGLTLVSELRSAAAERRASRCTSSRRPGWPPAGRHRRRGAGPLGAPRARRPSRPTSSSRSPSAAG